MNQLLNNVSNPGRNYTVSETSPPYYLFRQKYISALQELIVKASKIFFSIVVPQVDGRVFSTFVGKHQRI